MYTPLCSLVQHSSEQLADEVPQAAERTSVVQRRVSRDILARSSMTSITSAHRVSCAVDTGLLHRLITCIDSHRHDHFIVSTTFSDQWKWLAEPENQVW